MVKSEEPDKQRQDKWVSEREEFEAALEKHNKQAATFRRTIRRRRRRLFLWQFALIGLWCLLLILVLMLSELPWSRAHPLVYMTLCFAFLSAAMALFLMASPEHNAYGDRIRESLSLKTAIKIAVLTWVFCMAVLFMVPGIWEG